MDPIFYNGLISYIASEFFMKKKTNNNRRHNDLTITYTFVCPFSDKINAANSFSFVVVFFSIDKLAQLHLMQNAKCNKLVQLHLVDHRSVLRYFVKSTLLQNQKRMAKNACSPLTSGGS